MNANSYPHVKKGLSIVIGAVALMLLFLILGRFIAAIEKSYLLIIALCSVAELVGIIICALDKEKNFKIGIFCCAISIVIGIIGGVLCLIKETEVNALGITGLVLSSVSLAINIFVCFFILRGCINITGDHTVRLGAYFSIALTSISTVFYAVALFMDYFGAFPTGGSMSYNIMVVYCVIDICADLMFIFAIFKTCTDFNRQ